MSRSMKFAMLAALPLAALSLVASAQNTDPAPAANAHPDFFQHMLKKMDSNGDGKISLDEFLAASKARFQSLDTQGKGQITAADIAASPRMQKRSERLADRISKRLDSNGDGVISEDEFLAAAKARFARMDKNADGVIDSTEIDTSRWARAKATTPQE